MPTGHSQERERLECATKKNKKNTCDVKNTKELFGFIFDYEST